MSFLTDSIIIFSEKEIHVTIHINVFVPSGKEKCYFEIGVLAKSRTRNNKEKEVDISTINILLPIKTAEFEFEDLYERFKSNSEYLRLIFNQSSSMDENREFEIDNDKIVFNEIGDNVSSNKIILKLGKNKAKSHYFRFRLKNIKKERLCLEEETTSFVIDPFKRFINISGFHINNIRNYKDERFNLERNKIIIEKINIFFICDITATLIDSGILKQSFRLLEDDIWEKYISSDKNKVDNFKKKIIYQFKNEQNSIKDFKLFIKTSHINPNKVKYFVCFFIIILLANIIYDLFIADCIKQLRS